MSTRDAHAAIGRARVPIGGLTGDWPDQACDDRTTPRSDVNAPGPSPFSFFFAPRTSRRITISDVDIDQDRGPKSGRSNRHPGADTHRHHAAKRPGRRRRREAVAKRLPTLRRSRRSGAPGESRTPTPFRETDFESDAIRFWHGYQHSARWLNRLIKSTVCDHKCLLHSLLFLLLWLLCGF